MEVPLLLKQESPRILILMSIGASLFFPLSGCSIYTSVLQSDFLMPGYPYFILSTSVTVAIVWQLQGYAGLLSLSSLYSGIEVAKSALA